MLTDRQESLGSDCFIPLGIERSSECMVVTERVVFPLRVQNIP